MPELPEVEVVRRGLDDHVRGRTIATAVIWHPRAVRGHVAGPEDLAARMIGATITGTARRGKYLWLMLRSLRTSGLGSPLPMAAVICASMINAPSVT